MNSLSLVDSKHYYRGNIDCQPTFKYLYVYQKAFNILNKISVNNHPACFILALKFGDKYYKTKYYIL